MLRVQINTDNDAFQNGTTEAVRLLRKIADSLEAWDGTETYQTLLDINGNTVGQWRYDPRNHFERGTK